MAEADERPNDERDNTTKSSPRRRRIMIAAIAVATLLVLICIGFWFHHRITHVSGNDAQVATHEITVSSRLDGRVTGFDLIQGDQLTKDQRVAQLYKRPDRLKLQQIQAQIADIRARLALAKQQIAGGVDQTQLTLESDISAMHAARARMEKAHDNYRRAQKLYANHGGTEKQRDIYRYDYHAAQADYQGAQIQVKTERTAIANARTGVLPGGHTAQPPDILKSRLKAAQAQLAHQQNVIDDLAVASPIKGVIDQTFIEQDEYVSAGQPIVMMHDPNNVWIDAKIKETKIADLRVGQPVAIHVDARPDLHYHGHVQVIGHAATNQFALLPDPNPSGNFTKITQRIPVRIAIDHGPRNQLSPGMMVEVDINITGDGQGTNNQTRHPIPTRGIERNAQPHSKGSGKQAGATPTPSAPHARHLAANTRPDSKAGASAAQTHDAYAWSHALHLSRSAHD